MPFNGSGVYQRVRNWVADANAGIKIRADFHDSEDDGFAAGLTGCITKDGQTIVTQNIPFNSKRITGLADPINPQDASTKAYADTKMSATSGGTMTGDLAISTTTPILAINSTDGTPANLIGMNGGKNRWAIQLGNGTPETGGNTGSDFGVYRYDDAGNIIGASLARSSGQVVFGGAPGAGWGYMDASGLHMHVGGVSVPGDVFGATFFASGSFVVRTAANPALFLQDVDGTTRAQVGFDRAADALFLYGSTGLPVVLQPDSKVRLAGGWVSYNPNASYGTVASNMAWNGSAYQLYADATYIGDVAVTSDYRIKKDVAPLPSTWDAVKRLRPIRYTQADYGKTGDGTPLFTADGVERWGFVAHELQDVLTASAATGQKDEEHVLQSPNWPTIVAALTKTVQEMQDRIEALEGKT